MPLLCIARTAAGTPAEALRSASAVFQYGGREFLFIPTLATPDEADSACQGFGGNLATLYT